MIRVLYHWRVAAEDFEAFTDIWRATTDHIHASVPGALGSFMLRSEQDPSLVMTVARWESREAWEAFWGRQNPPQMQRMRELGERLAVEVFDEIGDHTR